MDGYRFHQYFGMTREQFALILYLVEPHIAKENTQLGDAISAHQRLSICIRCWDTRTGYNKEVQSFQGHEALANVFTSIDVNSDDRLVCAGTEAADHDVNILFWDRRKTTLLGCYSESHQDDITQVCFHPAKPNCLGTCSTDGLVCVFDINKTSEDDALMLTLNAESSVDRIGWCGSEVSSVYCLTDIGTFHIWDSQEGDSLQSRSDIKESLLEDCSVDYLVDCVPVNSESSPLLVAGTNSGVVRILDLSHNDIKTVTSLSGGHRDKIRCCHWNSQSERLVTGGEDSLLCQWSLSEGAQTEKTPNENKMKAKKKTPKRGTPY
ncbi:WD repeat-containing protein 89-like isoform X2 [Gigantopelta aegis]|uniref:WD repeat-containing protein 89-like isoform X2 n=1 Tax=Gigantopelta aegis TaxID=1735272 RepID=UPI001B88A04C|nr:WD repeat-containing protein 89-like isoform X2 [Gigantopelta aegis]